MAFEQAVCYLCDMFLEGEIKSLVTKDISQMLVSIAMKNSRKRKLLEVLQCLWSFSHLTKATATGNATLNIEQRKTILVRFRG